MTRFKRALGLTLALMALASMVTAANAAPRLNGHTVGASMASTEDDLPPPTSQRIAMQSQPTASRPYAPASDLMAPTEAARTSSGKQRLMVTPSLFNGGYRAARQGDNDIGLITIDAYNALRASHPGMAPAESVEETSRGQCAMTGSWIRRSFSIKTRIAQVRPRVDDISIRLLKLANDENKVSWLRRGAAVASTGAFCAIPGVGWLYCAGVAIAAVANEASGTVHDSANHINRDQSKLTNDITGIDLDTRDLDIDERVGWAEMVHGYCLDAYPDDTLGPPNAG